MSEILHLDWRRVDLGRQVAWLDPGTTKNGEGRGIPLNRDAVLALRTVQGKHPKWCFTHLGKRMEAIGSAWKRALMKAEILNFRLGRRPCAFPGDRSPGLTDRTPAQRPMPPSGL